MSRQKKTLADLASMFPVDNAVEEVTVQSAQTTLMQRFVGEDSTDAWVQLQSLRREAELSLDRTLATFTLEGTIYVLMESDEGWEPGWRFREHFALVDRFPFDLLLGYEWDRTTCQGFTLESCFARTYYDASHRFYEVKPNALSAAQLAEAAYYLNLLPEGRTIPWQVLNATARMFEPFALALTRTLAIQKNKPTHPLFFLLKGEDISMGQNAWRILCAHGAFIEGHVLFLTERPRIEVADIRGGLMQAATTLKWTFANGEEVHVLDVDTPEQIHYLHWIQA